MIIFELFAYLVLGVGMAGAQVYLKKETRALDVLTVGAIGALAGGALGLGLSHGANAPGFSVTGMIGAFAIAVASLLIFDLLRKPKKHSL